MGSYNYYRMFGCFNRKFKINETEPPPDVMSAFRRYTGGEPHMSTDQFASFLAEYQGETVSDAQAILHDVIHRRHHLTQCTRNGLTLDDLFYFLFQDDLNGPIPRQVHQDMTAPLNHYFIFTGHNSYLTGNQLSSDCSEIPIIKALERGVRGIELDLWPSSNKDNVHVLHGRTLTTPVTLLRCLKSIKEHAFLKSPYPVIITLEDHLTPDLQAKVAEMVTQVFGEMLYYPENGCLIEFPSPEVLKHRIILSTKPPKEYLETKQTKEEDVLPVEVTSSEEEICPKEPLECTSSTTKPLFHFLGFEAPEHILHSENDVKSRSDEDNEGGGLQTQKSSHFAPPQYKRLSAMNPGKGIDGLDAPECTTQSENSAESRSDEDGDLQTQKLPQVAPSQYKRLTAMNPGKEMDALDAPECTMQSEDDVKYESDQDDEDGDFPSRKASQLAPLQYKRLIAIHARKAKDGVRNALATVHAKVQRLSLNEQELEKVVSANATDIVRFTQKNILRVFPKGTRVTSSNFHPMIGWMHGAQMLAVNMQGYGKSLWLMHGMFRANGGCGYVKKPDFLLKQGVNNELFDPKVTLPVKKTLKVSVYLGDGWRLDFSHTHFDSYSPPDFYTKLYIEGVPADEAKKKTRIIEDEWGPIWDEEFTFPLTVPELALLRIEIREYDMSEKDDFGGQTCLPVSELRPGIRAVPMYDRKGEKLRSVRLLMRFQFV